MLTFPFKMEENELIYFWKWFNENATKLYFSFRQRYFNQPVQNIMNWGYSWEKGAGFIKINSLTIMQELQI